MAVVKLTARNIATLPGQSDRRVDYVDAILPGFTLRVSPRGSRTFAVRYFRNGKVQRYTIGPTPPLSLAAARDLARRVLADVTKGADPQCGHTSHGHKHSCHSKRHHHHHHK